MFRTEGGHPVALEDHCCHRNLPLSQGRVEGERIACGYHGLVFDVAGRCVQVPGQDTVPGGAGVRAFPLQERDGVLWIWPGDPTLADPQAIVSYPIHSDPRWAHRSTHYTIDCHHELINDNLLDLSHVGYVHGKTIGGTPGAHSMARMETQRTDHGVVVRRWMRGTVPPPTYQRAIGFEG